MGPKGAKPTPNSPWNISSHIYQSIFPLLTGTTDPLEFVNSHTPSGAKATVSDIKRRSRMISVRLSEEEYAALIHLCSLTGARSVSDLTRDAMRAVVKRASGDEPFGNSLEEFRAGMKNIEKKVEALEAKIMLSRSEETR